MLIHNRLKCFRDSTFHRQVKKGYLIRVGYIELRFVSHFLKARLQNIMLVGMTVLSLAICNTVLLGKRFTEIGEKVTWQSPSWFFHCFKDQRLFITIKKDRQTKNQDKKSPQKHINKKCSPIFRFHSTLEKKAFLSFQF